MTRKKNPEEKLKVGRPSKYTEQLASTICARLSAGESLRSVCRDEDMPSAVTVFNWLREFPEFLKQYERAKQESADALAEEILDIADNGTNDWMEKEYESGHVAIVLNGEAIQRSRLRVDARKWLASKLKPKKYGDKMDLTSDGKALSISFDGAFEQKEKKKTK